MRRLPSTSPRALGPRRAEVRRGGARAREVSDDPAN